MKKEISIKSKKAISLISLVITIIVIIILSSIVIVQVKGMADKAAYSTFATEFAKVREQTDIVKKEKFNLINKDWGFKRIRILNSPSRFYQRFSRGNDGITY